jgi:hypothetical protein
MNNLTKSVLAAALLLSAPVFAEDPHHPDTAGAPAGTTAPEAAPPAAPPSGTGSATMGGGVMGGGMMDGNMMGGDMMKMMSGMMSNHMRMMQGMMSAMGATGAAMGQMMSPEHVEGRIAFLRTELKVTDAQQPLWEAVAEALRAAARAPGDTMQQDASQTLTSALERRERMLAARLDAVRGLRSAVEPFYAALDAAQKATADKLMGPMGMM